MKHGIVLALLMLFTFGCIPPTKARQALIATTFKTKLLAKSEKWNWIRWDKNDPEQNEAAVSVAYRSSNGELIFKGTAEGDRSDIRVSVEQKKGESLVRWRLRNGTDFEVLSNEPNLLPFVKEFSPAANDLAVALYESLGT